MLSNDPVFFAGTPAWGWHPDRREHEAGYTLFRRKFLTEQDHTRYHIGVSADNRYTLFLDGKLLGRGPLRGDIDHYFYQEYEGDLAAGEHVLSAEVIVWRGAWLTSSMAWSEMHAGGGFLCWGYAGSERMELPDRWECRIDTGRRSLSLAESFDATAFFAAPPLEEVDFARYDPKWMTGASDDWRPVRILSNAVFHHTYLRKPSAPWYLLKQPVHSMSESFVPIAGILTSPASVRLEKGHLTGSVPEGKHLIRIDLGKNMTCMVHFSGASGRGNCRIAYAETLYDKDGERLRQASSSGSIGSNGCADQLKFAGKPWKYDSFWYRTGRFMELVFELTEPITALDLSLDFITYPYGEFKSFSAPDPILEKIYDVACHTLKCCSHEHFEDCPYYEQMLYAGDARVEALVSYAATGKDDLGRHAIRLFAVSQQSNGLTQSRYPCVVRQVIPIYSLIWALMVHDHYVCFHDPELVKKVIPNVRFMLDAFERARRPDGLIGFLRGWHYVDWVQEWPRGCMDRETGLPDIAQNLFFAEACRKTAELCTVTGTPAPELLERAERTVSAVNRHCFDAEANRYFDVPGHPEWKSLHANVLAVLFGAVPMEKRSAFLRETASDTTLSPMTLYFSFYLLLAVRKYGTAAELRKHYAPWEEMLKLGCTTFPETPPPCRSECHAWSCAPVWFLRPETAALDI